MVVFEPWFLPMRMTYSHKNKLTWLMRLKSLTTNITNINLTTIQISSKIWLIRYFVSKRKFQAMRLFPVFFFIPFFAFVIKAGESPPQYLLLLSNTICLYYVIVCWNFNVFTTANSFSTILSTSKAVDFRRSFSDLNKLLRILWE